MCCEETPIMKFAFCGNDFFYEALEETLDHDFALTALITAWRGEGTEVDSRRVISLAERLGVPVVIGRLTVDRLHQLLETGTTAIFAAVYPFRIPLTAEIPFGFNLHPSALPEWRGVTPFTNPILSDSSEAGVTLHQLSPEFDAGDILHQKKFALNDNDTYETVIAKCQIAGVKVMREFAASPDLFWASKRPQEGGSYSTLHTREDQTIDWSRSTSEIDRWARAFGKTGVYCEIEGDLFKVRSLRAWRDEPIIPVGQVVVRRHAEVTISVRDGFVCLTDFEKVD
jgi:methionyl-tRNA formyltransferase